MDKRAKFSLILVVELILWNTVLMKPIRLFSVFLHELGHAGVAMLFGGKVHSFQVNLDESGSVLATSRGWLASFMIANGGYLGGVLLSVLILWLGHKYGGKYVLGATAIVIVSVAAIFSGVSMTLMYAAIFSLAVLLIFMTKNSSVENTALEIIGVGALAYGVYDTFVDTILFELNKVFPIVRGWTSKEVTDAVQLRNLTGIPAIVWGVAWLGISLMIIYSFFLRHKGKGAAKKTAFRPVQGNGTNFGPPFKK